MYENSCEACISVHVSIVRESGIVLLLDGVGGVQAARGESSVSD